MSGGLTSSTRAGWKWESILHRTRRPWHKSDSTITHEDGSTGSVIINTSTVKFEYKSGATEILNSKLQPSKMEHTVRKGRNKLYAFLLDEVTFAYEKMLILTSEERTFYLEVSPLFHLIVGPLGKTFPLSFCPKHQIAI